MDADPTVKLAAQDRRQLERVTRLVRAALAEAAIGSYLHGSAVDGGLKPASDLDVLVVAARRTTPDERRALVDGLLATSGRRAVDGPARSVELSVVVGSDVRPWRYPPRLDFQYGDWLRTAFERGNPQPWRDPDPDLAVLLTNVRQQGRPLFGPPAADLLDAVPRPDLEHAMLETLGGVLDDLPSDARNVVLTLARIWATLATGEIRSKEAAAAWALGRLPPEQQPVLARARAIYLGEETERWDDLDALVRRHVDHVVAEIRRAAASR